MVRRFRAALVLGLLLLSLFPVTAVASGAPAISFSVDKPNVGVGQSFTLTVSVAGAQDVYGTSVDLTYDPNVLEFVSGTPGTLVSSAAANNQKYTTSFDTGLSSDSHRATAIALLLGEQVGTSGGGAIATFTFKVRSGSSYTFTMQNTQVEMVNSAGQLITGLTGADPVTVTFVGTPHLRLAPRAEAVVPGGSLLVDVFAENIPADLATIAFELRYPPSLLDAISIDETGGLFEGSQLPPFEYIDVNPDTGLAAPGAIQWTMTGTAGVVPGRSLVGTISFNVLANAVPGSASLNFESIYGAAGPNGVSFLDKTAAEIPGGTSSPAQVQIVVGGTLSGTVRLIGRPTTRPGRTDYKGWGDVQVQVIDPVTNSVKASGITTFDGKFTVAGIPAGTYTVRFTRPQFLSFAVKEVPITVGQTTSLDHMTIQMRPGNMKDNVTSTDRVGGEDLTLLGQAWNSRPTNPATWNAAADLNDDLVINPADLTLLGQAWNKRGSTYSTSDQVLVYTAPAP